MGKCWSKRGPLCAPQSVTLAARLSSCIQLTPGVGGYSVFSNLYFNGGILYAVSADEEAAALIPETKLILTGAPEGNRHPPAGMDRWSAVVGADLARSELGTRAVRLPGVSVSLITHG